MVLDCAVLWGQGNTLQDDGTCLGPQFVNFVMMAFFGLWNMICSNMVLVPLFRFFYFGIKDVHGRKAFVGLICPHWAVGLVVPLVVGGLFSWSIGTVLPYLVCGYRVNKLCRAERSKGKMIEVKEEVDIFIDGKKTMRISKIRMTDDRLMFECYGKRYGTKVRKPLEFMLSPTQLYISNELMALFTGNLTRPVSFVDMRGHNAKLILTELTGVQNSDSMGAPQLPTRQDSMGRRLFKMTSTDYHFTSVARPVPSTPTVSAYSGIVPALIPSQPVLAVATIVPPDSEAGYAKATPDL